MKFKKKNPRYQHIRNSVKDYFTFTRSERNGVLVLSILLVVLLGILYYVRFFAPPPARVNADEFEKEIKAFETSLTPIKENKLQATGSGQADQSVNNKSPVELFAFNPNNLSKDNWKKLGAPDWIIERIKKYESKGGHFKAKEDLQKIYSLPPELFAKWEPFISIPVEEKNENQDKIYNPIASHEEKKPQEIILIDLNLADESELDALPLIGPSRAKAIVNYRNRLHGYYRKEQLHEVWSINDTVYNAISDRVGVKAKFIQPLSINVSDPSLLQHPYISYSLAKMIVSYRNAHGNYKDIAEIKNLPLVNEDLYTKLAPYLKID